MRKITTQEIKAIKKGLEICEEAPTMANVKKFLESGAVRFVYDNRRIFVNFDAEFENGECVRTFRFTWIDIATLEEL